MTDEELVVGWQKGNMISFGMLYDRYKDELFRTACFIAGNRTDAEDLVQQAFVTTAERIGGIRDGAKIRSFLLRTLTHAAWKQSKKKRRETPVDTFFEDAATQGSALDEVLVDEAHRALYAAMQELDEKRRMVIVLYYFNELSVRQIATVTGTLEGTVKSRLHSARKQMKQYLQTKENAKGERINHA